MYEFGEPTILEQLLQDERDSPKLNFFCAVSATKLHDPFIFQENTVKGIGYCLLGYIEWVAEDSDKFVWAQDGAPSPLAKPCERFLGWKSFAKVMRWLSSKPRSDSLWFMFVGIGNA